MLLRFDVMNPMDDLEDDAIGSGFTTITNGGSPSIKGGVLTAFKKISEDTIVWERGEKKWRKREFYDGPGREQP